ncbi:MAG: lipid-A-disaccharide synthase [Candidatus Omnitrophica bacterium]|nr:lipid-A-disaccharide synthase [Candidatus Omnitrophota bacterium]MBU4303113.1 lipid-A-disaccharide synthase [Candidatus Omnitrophota bacterium]MBU4418282.1 lipid-A-disaccharide synthase [Candidatus Omnitrophota bacterium]MBU4467798.1 lipid-A-disaccharide synthase [Candidatus Omnitrophota bacterium]MCG2708307.1 lipid-A-disaccharide synthase [Candidatus Omnitrophota bacterium]
MAQINKILIVCGEPSGDLLAANLVGAIKKLNPDIKISGLGGTHLARAGCEIFCDIKGLSVMGFFDVLKKLPKFLKLKKLILRKIDTDKPDAIILVDFSGFNLRLACAINKRLPVIYYVSPQIWASRGGRINCIKKFISMLVVLFKFEEKFYRQRQIPVTCVGHPLIDLVNPSAEKQDFRNSFGIDPAKKIIALLPGSRKQEVKLILPLMLKTAQLINKVIPDTQFIIAKSPNLDTQLYLSACKNIVLDLKIVNGLTYDCLNIAQASLVCSGTATLEAAIMQKPFVIVYKTNLLNYLLYRPQIKIPYIGMVNIVAGKRIVPEFIQFSAQPKMIAKSIIELLQNPLSADRMIQDLKTVKDSLGEPGAAGRAAKLILDFIQG